MIRILIVDDQNLVQQGIKSLLERDMEFKIIGTLKDGRETIERVTQLNPDIVLLDIEMPGMDGITATKYIARVSPNTKIIILSSHENTKYVTQALIAGAKGYLLKTSLMTDLKQAILAVNSGYSQIDSRLLAKVFDRKNIKVRKNNSHSQISQNSASLEISKDNQLSPSVAIESQVNSSSVKPTLDSKIEREDRSTSNSVELESVPQEYFSSKSNLPQPIYPFTEEKAIFTPIIDTSAVKKERFTYQFSKYKNKLLQWIDNNSRANILLYLALIFFSAIIVIFFS